MTGLWQFAFLEGASDRHQWLGVPDFRYGRVIKISNLHFQVTRTKSNVEARVYAEDANPRLLARICLPFDEGELS